MRQNLTLENISNTWSTHLCHVTTKWCGTWFGWLLWNFLLKFFWFLCSQNLQSLKDKSVVQASTLTGLKNLGHRAQGVSCFHLVSYPLQEVIVLNEPPVCKQNSLSDGGMASNENSVSSILTSRSTSMDKYAWIIFWCWKLYSMNRKQNWTLRSLMNFCQVIREKNFWYN